MIIFQVNYGLRRGRVFCQAPPENELRLAAQDFLTQDDLERVPVLYEALGKSKIVAAVHPTQGEPDVRQVFLRDGGHMIFACVLVSQERLLQMLEETGCVVEGMSLQVAPTEWLTDEAIRVGLHMWTERNFPRVQPPVFLLDPWHEALEPQEEALRYLELSKLARSREIPDLFGTAPKGQVFSPQDLVDDGAEESPT